MILNTLNQKVYIHEFIDLRGMGRARSMHHMSANWSPIAQAERKQKCFGVWGTVASTGRWPEVVNIWEEDGWRRHTRETTLGWERILLVDAPTSTLALGRQPRESDRRPLDELPQDQKSRS